MINKIIIFFLVSQVICFTGIIAQSNVGINASGIPDASSILDVNSTSLGLLIPRMSTTNRDLIVSPANGLILYNTSTNNLNVNKGSTNLPNFVSLFNGAATMPLTYSTANGFGIDQANTSTNGYLLLANWNTFNTKQNLLNNTASVITPGFITFTGTSPSYDNTLTYCSSFGITNYLPKFTASNALQNSLIYDNGTNVGISLINPTLTAAATSTLQVNGSFATAVASFVGFNGYQSITINHYTILASPASNTGNGQIVSLQLPTTVGITGRVLTIKNVTGFTIKIKTFSATQTIDGNNYFTTPYTYGVGIAGQAITLQTDGNAWYIIGIH